MEYMTHCLAKAKSFITTVLFTLRTETGYKTIIGSEIQFQSILIALISPKYIPFLPLPNIIVGDKAIKSTICLLEKLSTDNLLFKSYLTVIFFIANLESVKFSIYKQSPLEVIPCLSGLVLV